MLLLIESEISKKTKISEQEVEKELINHTDKIVIDKVFNYFYLIM